MCGSTKSRINVAIILTVIVSSMLTALIGFEMPLLGECTLSADAQGMDERPATLSGTIGIAVDMRFFNGKGGGDITVSVEGAAAAELRRRMDSVYYLTLSAPNRNNSKVDGSIAIPGEVNAFAELFEDRLEESQSNNIYDLFNTQKKVYDGVFSGVDISRKGGSKGVDIKSIEGLTDTSISSTDKFVIELSFGGALAENYGKPAQTGAEIIFYALFGYEPDTYSALNESEPDLSCHETVHVVTTGLGSLSTSNIKDGSVTKYRIPGGEILTIEQDYGIGDGEGSGYIDYDPFDFVQSSVVLSIAGLIMGIIILSIPRSIFKGSGRPKKVRWVHLMAIGFFLAIVLIFFMGGNGIVIWLSGILFIVITAVTAHRTYAIRIDGHSRSAGLAARQGTSARNPAHEQGLLAFENGDLNKALEFFDRALDNNIEDEIVWNDKGHVLRKLGRYDEALKCFNIALKINPDYAIALQNKRKTITEMKSTR